MTDPTAPKPPRITSPEEALAATVTTVACTVIGLGALHNTLAQAQHPSTTLSDLCCKSHQAEVIALAHIAAQLRRTELTLALADRQLHTLVTLGSEIAEAHAVVGKCILDLAEAFGKGES